jgi:flavin reductase (DIM6/NTAB) family NADH-FMN oxidoreductase RutF
VVVVVTQEVVIVVVEVECCRHKKSTSQHLHHSRNNTMIDAPAQHYSLSDGIMTHAVFKHQYSMHALIYRQVYKS